MSANDTFHEGKNEPASSTRSTGVSIRQRTWEIVAAARPDDPPSQRFDVFIMTLIFLNVLVVVIGTVEAVDVRFGTWLWAFEVFSVAVFSIEYIARVWSSTVVEPYRSQGPIRGRIRFAMTPLALIDLMAVLPFYLPLFGVDLRFLRVLRLLRILRIVKLGRYLPALMSLKRVIRKKKEELVLSFSVLVLLLVVAASLVYYAEREAQPEVFSSIPATMWWAVATLTTVGYGDVYPVTMWGKLLASATAILGIGLFALPASILASGFQEELDRLRAQPHQSQEHRYDGGHVCPHCGEPLDKLPTST